MPRFLSVKTEMNAAAKLFPQLADKQRQVARDSINKTATLGERESVATVAKDMNLPERVVRNRLDLSGRVKDRRTKIRRASMARLNAELEVYVRGIPVSQIAGAQIRRPGGGVKAKGGRFYKGAFRHGQQVFKRIGRERTPLMVPKVGVRERLRKEFDKRLTGAEGIERFRRNYLDACRRQLARYGVKA